MLDQSMPLMEILAEKTGCTVLSDWCYLSPKRQKQIARRSAFIPGVGFSLQEWNNTLHYIVRPPPT